MSTPTTRGGHVPPDRSSRPLTCVAVRVTNKVGKVCLIRHARRGTWEMPGGGMYEFETIAQAAKREVMEEAGLDVTVHRGPAPAVDGIRGVVVIICFGTAEGEPTAGSDAVEAGWFGPEEIPWDRLSSVVSNDVLRAWAKEQRKGDFERKYLADWQVKLRSTMGASCCVDEDCDLSGGFAHVGPCDPCRCGARHAIDECPFERGLPAP